MAEAEFKFLPPFLTGAMDPAKFRFEQKNNLIQLPDGAWAYVPPPLPPQINLSELALPLASAAAAVGELKGAARRLQNPYMLTSALQRREALTSSAMEGTFTTLGDIVLEEAGAAALNSDDARETFNYVRSLERATAMIKELPLSHRVIKAAHEILLKGLSPARGAGKRPGEYKTHQNAVGKQGDTVQSARYVPPPPAEAQICMDQLEAFINRERTRPAEILIDLALAHYQFEAIHPFADGNGRIGRMLTTLMAIQTGLTDIPLLHISATLESKKDEYIDRLFAVSTEGRWNEWICFFLASIEQSSVKATALVDRILSLQAELRQRAAKAGKSPRLPMIVDSLFDKSWTTTGEIQKLCGITFPTAQSDIRTLVNSGILTEMDWTKPKLYYAPDIVALSDRG